MQPEEACRKVLPPPENLPFPQIEIKDDPLLTGADPSYIKLVLIQYPKRRGGV
jgi:hypothetical protein